MPKRRNQGVGVSARAVPDAVEGTRIPMDGKGRCLHNIFVGRLRPPPKHEGIPCHAWEAGSRAKARISGS
ncbi:hypothetical protein FDP22_20490 (plasmid) [Paroceanicella profunda]|uniref:Uncharacterized protein n=1 Tax=Paroceanicella profunda TaxID=2579971 RepID=A0A5B8FJA6_9RHOB|nr:hypothetical protein [Paroceanicella profunda]QDL94227.1 hypothetical protein FDP22_20490 [Paroceanicella profunda]